MNQSNGIGRTLFAASVVTALAAATLAAGAAQAQVSGDVVKIGLLSDQSGPYADNVGPGATVAARLAVEDFGGTVLGKKIEFVIGDDQNKPDIGTGLVRRWIDQDGVDALVSGSNSGIALGLQEIMKERKKPYMIAGTGSSDLTGKACSPYAVQWAYDTYVLPKAMAGALVKQGLDTWYFITVDYAFGHAWEKDTSAFVTAAGGKVVGAVRHPLGTADFSSFLLQAQASKAKVIALANAGPDFSNAVKQAKEFGIMSGGQTIAVMGTTLNAMHGIGLETTQGMQFATPFYWDQNDETRAWSKRFMAGYNNKAPNFIQAATYSAVLHYLKAVQAAGTDNGEAVMAKLKAMPVNDFSMKNVPIRIDGNVMRPMHLVKVKKPAESKSSFDIYSILTEVAAEQSWRPLSEGGCAFAMKQ